MRIRTGTFWDVRKFFSIHSAKSLIQAVMSIRIITVHGDGGGPLLEATRA